MKKFLTLLAMAVLTFSLCLSATGCQHTHSFSGGKCTCGAIDPNHECIFFEGKCIICDKDDPNPNYVITGDYGVTAEVHYNYVAAVNTVDVKSEESEEIRQTLEQNDVQLTDRAWVMYNFTITPEEGKETSEDDGWQYRIVIPAPVPEEEEYVVWCVDDEKAEEVESTYEEESVIIYGEYKTDYNVNYVVYTEQVFNVVEYYKTHEEGTIPEHINVGNDTAEDAYQKGQTRSLEVYVCVNGNELSDDEYAVSVEGYKWQEYNSLGKELYYQQMVYLNAERMLFERKEQFLGWYIGGFNEEGKIVLEDTPYYTDLELEFEMPARDLKLFAVYGHISSFEVMGLGSKVSVDGSEFYDYVTAEIHPVKNYVTLSVQPMENYYFSHWAYEDNYYAPECFLSDEPTFVYTVPVDEHRNVVAVCEAYSRYTYTVYGVCSEGQVDDYAEYKFIINGEDYHDDYYEDTFWEYETFHITAVPVRGCRFLGWAVISLREDATYDSCKDKIISTDATYIINKDNCANFRNNKLIAVYEMLPQYDFEASCYFIDDNYGSFASIYVDGDARGDNFYATRLAEGEQVTIKAVPEMNCKFEGWYYYTMDDHSQPIFGALASADAEFTFTMGTETTYVIAKLRCYPTYSISAYAGEGGDIYINGENHYGSVRYAYEEGEKLTIKVEVKDGFEFKGWYKAGATTEQLITTDVQFEYTVGTSDADFEARLEPIIYYNIKLEIKSPALTVDIDEHKDLPYIPDTEIYRVYVTMRREGDSVTIKANNVEGEDFEFSHWMINGYAVYEREHTFTVETEDVMIYAVARARVHQLELRYRSNQTSKVVYATDYETGNRYISTVSVDQGAMITPNSVANLFDGLYIVRYDTSGESRYSNIFNQCIVDFGGATKDSGDGYYMFDMPGRYTVTITDKSNPELSISFTLQVVGYDPTGTYVWVSRTGEKYHENPHCSNMQTVTAMTVEEAIAAGYEACNICCGEE